MAAKGAKVTINERKLNSLRTRAKKWPRGKRALLHDGAAPGGAVRIYGGSGAVSLGMIARFPLHPDNPTFRKIADYVDAKSLPPWRDKVREWGPLIDQGRDPEVEEARQRAAEQRKQVNSFAAVWDAFYEQHASKLVKADEARRAGAAFLKAWGIRSASEIEPVEISAHIRQIAKKTPEEARNRLGHLRRMYSWAIGSGGFGLSANPCSVLKPADLIGRKESRDRVLTDDELRAVWAACSGPAGIEALKEARQRKEPRAKNAPLGYPYGPLFRLMILLGQRETECAGMSWGEVHFDKALWVIPKERMKMDRAHAVPLAPDALALLLSLPRFAGGNFVFSTTDGAKPVNGFSKTKERLDALSGVQEWVLHDLRRTMRTHLSALPVQDMVRELVIAHAKPGLHKVYDQHAYEDEKRECLTLWEARLRGILAPKPPADVADLGKARAARGVVNAGAAA